MRHYSNHTSYSHGIKFSLTETDIELFLVAKKRIELFYPAYETSVLPINYIALKSWKG